MTIQNLDSLHPDIMKPVKRFSTDLIDLHGDNLLSLLVYGLATEKSFSMKFGRISMLAVFNSVDIDVLRSSLKVVRKGNKKKIIAPLFFSESHIQTSLDTFPIEFLEIKNRHVCIYGQDFFKDISVDTSNLRFVCEQKIKSLVISLQQSYLEVGLAKKGIERLVLESFDALLPLFRAVLVVKGEAVPEDKESLIMQVCSLANISSAVFMMVLKDRAGDEQIGGQEAVQFLGNYLGELQKLTQFIDAA